MKLWVLLLLLTKQSYLRTQNNPIFKIWLLVLWALHRPSVRKVHCEMRHWYKKCLNWAFGCSSFSVSWCDGKIHRHFSINHPGCGVTNDYSIDRHSNSRKGSVWCIHMPCLCTAMLQQPFYRNLIVIIWMWTPRNFHRIRIAMENCS